MRELIKSLKEQNIINLDELLTEGISRDTLYRFLKGENISKKSFDILFDRVKNLLEVKKAEIEVYIAELDEIKHHTIFKKEGVIGILNYCSRNRLNIKELEEVFTVLEIDKIKEKLIFYNKDDELILVGYYDSKNKIQLPGSYIDKKLWKNFDTPENIEEKSDYFIIKSLDVEKFI